MNNPSTNPIFILGMLQRTGTNHLWDLFGLHPDVELLRPVFEDHLMQWSPHLIAYVEDVISSWDPAWGVPPEEGEALRFALGEGLARWVASHSDKRVVTKMPSVEQAHHFFDLLPDCPLVILVRDGRDVAESMSKSFDMSRERAFRRWSLAAGVVLQLKREHADRANFAIVRFEDVVDQPVETMRELCAVVGLDPARFPYHAIDALPIRGSSTLRADQAVDMHWLPVEDDGTFDPHARWSDWGDHEHRRFAQVAGEGQLGLGYALVHVAGRSSPGELVRSARDRTHTAYREVRTLLQRAVRAIRRVHGRI